MRARVAYISSLGTTAILVAAALLMLAVVSAIVAFRGWPGGEAGGQVQPVPLSAPPAAARVAFVRADAPPSPSVVRRLTSAAVPAASRSLSTAGLVKQVPARPVSGIVLVPAGASPMRGAGPQPLGPNGGPVTPGGPLPGPGGGPLPDPGAGGGFDPGGAVPLPLPSAGTLAPPSTAGLSSAVGQLLAQAPPPPRAVTAITGRLR